MGHNLQETIVFDSMKDRQIWMFPVHVQINIMNRYCTWNGPAVLEQLYAFVRDPGGCDTGDLLKFAVQRSLIYKNPHIQEWFPMFILFMLAFKLRYK